MQDFPGSGSPRSFFEWTCAVFIQDFPSFYSRLSQFLFKTFPVFIQDFSVFIPGFPLVFLLTLATVYTAYLNAGGLHQTMGPSKGPANAKGVRATTALCLGRHLKNVGGIGGCSAAYVATL